MEGLLCGDGLSRDAKVQGVGTSYSPWQQYGSHGRKHPEPDLRLSQVCVWGGNDPRAPARELQASAETLPPDDCAGRYPKVCEIVEEAVEGLEHRRGLFRLVFFDTGTKAEVITGPFQDDKRRAVGDLSVQRKSDRLNHGSIQDVGLWAVQEDVQGGSVQVVLGGNHSPLSFAFRV